MKKYVLVLTVFVLLLLPISAKAAEFITDKSGNVSVAKTETPKNLYTTGANVTVDANVAKDLIAAGSVMNINGAVQDNLVVMGGTINVTNTVGGNAYICGGNITMNNTTQGDLLIGGGNIVLGSQAVVNGDLLVAGGTVDIKGKVLGNVKVAGGTVTISGNIAGDVTSRDSQSLTLASTALIGGKLTYYSPNTATIDTSAQIIGGTQYNKTASNSLKSMHLAAFWMAILFGIFGVLITLLVFIYLLPKTANRIISESYGNFWRNLLYGLVFLVVTPIVIIFLFVLSVTAVLGGILALVYILALIAAGLIGTLLVGVGLMKWLNKAFKGYRMDWLTILVGVIAVAILKQIPFFGGLAVFIFFLTALGTLFDLTRNKIKASR